MQKTAEIRILDAAVDLFSMHGISSVSTKQIAERAKVNESTLFRLFKTKKALARAVARYHFFDDKPERLNPKVIERGDVREIARLYAVWYSQFLSTHCIRLYLRFALEMPDVFEQEVVHAHAAFMEAIKAAQSRGEAHDIDPAFAVRALHDAIWGDAVLRVIRHPIVNGTDPSSGLIAAFSDIWTRGMVRESSSAQAAACI